MTAPVDFFGSMHHLFIYLFISFSGYVYSDYFGISVSSCVRLIWGEF
jgi:hypothetical protein